MKKFFQGKNKINSMIALLYSLDNQAKKVLTSSFNEVRFNIKRGQTK